MHDPTSSSHHIDRRLEKRPAPARDQVAHLSKMDSVQNILPLIVSGITKRFGAVTALSGVDLTITRGECLAVVGENGAGKSTLMKILAGVEQPDHGTLLLNGHSVRIHNTRHAQNLGICLIHQELQLIQKLSVVDNIFLGREKTHFGLLRTSNESTRAKQILGELGLDLDPRITMDMLSVAEQQIVEIAKGLSQDAELVIMDEPTSALAPAEVERLFAVIRELIRRNKGVIYISHRIDEIGQIANRVIVLRDGLVAGGLPGGADSHQVVSLMIGREIEEFYPKTHHSSGETVMQVKDIYAPGVNGVSFDLHRGEIVGIGGLVGAGQRELANVLFGRTKPISGEIHIGGAVHYSFNPSRALRNGLSMVPEDRRIEGLNQKASVKENITLPILGRVDRMGFLNTKQLTDITMDQMKSLRIRASSPNQNINELSGGNQQKVVVAKALVSEPEILILVEPTRGVDVGAKVEIYEILDQLSAEGKAVVLVSSDLNELRGMSDQIVILYRGRVAGKLTQPEASRERVTMLATGQIIEDISQ
jgi:ribose transport system ATP-binding protein